MDPRLRTLGVLAALVVLCSAAGARSTVFDDEEEEGTARSDQHVATVPLEHAFGVRMSVLAPRAAVAAACSAAGCRLRNCGCRTRLHGPHPAPPRGTGPSIHHRMAPLLKSVPPVRGPPPV